MAKKISLFALWKSLILDKMQNSCVCVCPSPQQQQQQKSVNGNIQSEA